MSKVIIKRKAQIEAEEQLEYDKRKKISTISDLSQIGDIRAKKEPSAKAGSIERIYMKNFKCHTVLEFDLHKSINFILGRNGSGKSAVMDAVILCLGGNARSTGRQASAKTFIKTNHDKAELSITLRNEGDDAYKSSEYGNRITIERKISGDGASTYRLLSSDHKTVSNKKTEVDNIIEQFNIQVNNPVCFLNQETSKHFLNSSNNSDKYKLFMKASQLESMKQIQEEIEIERQNCKVLIEEKESHLPKLEEELFEWEDKYKKCQSVDKLRKKLNALMQEYAWSFAIEYEKKIEELQKSKRITLKSKEKIEQKTVETEENFKKICEDFDRFRQDINEIKVKTQELNEKYSKHEKIYKEKHQRYKQVQNDTKKYQSVIKHKKVEHQQLMEKYEEEKQKNQQDFQEDRARIETKINNLKEEINKLSSQEKVKANENQQYTAEIDRNAKLLQDRQYELSSLDKRVESLKADITTMKNSNKNKIFQFGEYMNDLCNEVKAMSDRGKFKQLPRGPIGMFVEPVKHEWALAIEQCLGGSVTSFICGNYDDERLMHQLIAKYVKNPIQRPRVIVSKFGTPLHDVSAYRPPLMQYPTVYEMLKISDPIVANALIDQRKIESVLLLPNRDIGREIMERNVPANCNEAFLPNGDQLYGRPSYRAYACGPKQPKIFIKDVQSNIESKELEIKRSIEQREIYKKEMKEIGEKIQSNRTLRQNNENLIDGLKRNVSNLKYKLKEAEGVQIPEPVDLAVYEEEINKITAEIKDVENKMKNEVENYDLIKSEFEAADQERQVIEAERQKHSEFVEQVRTNHSQHDDDKTTAKEAFNHYKKLLDDVLKQLSDKDAEIQKNETDLAKYAEVASEMCPRIDTKRQSKTIETEIQQNEIQIKLSEKNHGSEEEIGRTYMEMKTRYNNIISDIAKQKGFLKRLKQILIDREKFTKTSIQSKSVRCAVDFSNLVNSRDYNGTLKFDHENQKLEINVHPNKSRETNDARDLKSLSGGERSFSTVSFLLALWTIVESPILFLDEFDVFMDQVNRRFAMELILNAAKERLSGQYVFLTPQEMGFIQLDNSLKVFKMPDPTRAIDMTDDDGRNN